MQKVDYPFHYGFIEAVKHNNLTEELAGVENDDFQNKNPFQWTPLHYAAAFGNYEYAHKILQAHSDWLNIIDRYQRTALSLAAVNGDSRLCGLLLKFGADVSIGLALCYAVTGGNSQCVINLVNSGCDVNEEDYPEFRTKYTPLVIAAKQNNLELTKILIDHSANTNFGVGKHQTPLHWACQDGSLEIVEALLIRETELNSRCEHNNTPLEYALINGKLDVVKYLLSKGSSVNILDKMYSTPFHAACSTNFTDCVKEILKYKPDINAQDSDGFTPLLLCSYGKKDQEDIFECLVNNGADINISAYNSWTPLHMCCAVGNLKCAQILLGKLNKSGVNAVTMDNVTPLYLAAAQGHVDICKELLESQAYLNIKVNKLQNLQFNYPGVISSGIIKDGYDAKKIALEQNHDCIVELLNDYELNHSRTNLLNIAELTLEKCVEDSDKHKVELLGWRCLHHACDSNNLGLIEECIRTTGCVDIMDKYLRTPLTIAAANGYLNAVNLLIKHGADPNLGFTLLYAIQNNQIECVKYLICAGANVNIRDKKGRTPLMHSVMKNDVIITRLLLESSADISVSDNERDTALHFACPHGYNEIVTLLIKHGADVNAQNSFHETPLHMAAASDDKETLHLLLEHGANTDLSNHFLETPLHHLAMYGSKECVEEILKYSPDLNIKNDELSVPLFCSLDNHDRSVTKLLIQDGANLDDTLPQGWTVLHYAAFDGLVELLVEYDLDVNAINSEGISALYVAAARGHFNFVKLLIEKGAIVDAAVIGLQDWRDRLYFERGLPVMKSATPLMVAVCNGHLEIVEYLYLHGASITMVTGQNMTPLHLAVLNAHFHIFKFLIEHGCRVKAVEKEHLLGLANNEEFKMQIQGYLSELSI